MKVLIFLFLYSAILYSQWNRIETIPEEYLNFIYSNNDTIYTATDSLIYISRDDGISWSVLSNQSPSYTEAVIKVNNILYAGTYGKGVFRSTDDGITWNAFNNGLLSWGMQAIQFYTMNNKIYLATDGGGVYYLDILNPVKWIEYNENLPSLIGWTAICMTGSKNSLILSSGASGFIFTRPEGSAGWNSGYLDSLRKPQAKSLLALGNYVFAGTLRTIYKSTDGGIQWDSVGIKAIPLLSSVLKSAGNTIYAGVSRPNEFWVWTSVDSGNTWQFVDHQFFDLQDLHITTNSIFAATGSGLLSNKLVPVSVPLHIDQPVPEEAISVYPNPFNPVTKIKIRLPEDGFIILTLYNVLGEKISEIFRGEYVSGVYEYRFDGGHLSGGVYVFTLQQNSKSYSKKIILLK